MNSLRSLWFKIRQNPYFVAFEGGAGGAVFNFLDDSFMQGHLDFTAAGVHKLCAAALIGGFTAVKLLYRPAPGQNPK